MNLYDVFIGRLNRFEVQNIRFHFSQSQNWVIKFVLYAVDVANLTWIGDVAFIGCLQLWYIGCKLVHYGCEDRLHHELCHGRINRRKNINLLVTMMMLINLCWDTEYITRAKFKGWNCVAMFDCVMDHHVKDRSHNAKFLRCFFQTGLPDLLSA